MGASNPYWRRAVNRLDSFTAIAVNATSTGIRTNSSSKLPEPPSGDTRKICSIKSITNLLSKCKLELRHFTLDDWAEKLLGGKQISSIASAGQKQTVYNVLLGTQAPSCNQRPDWDEPTRVRPRKIDSPITLGLSTFNLTVPRYLNYRPRQFSSGDFARVPCAIANFSCHAIHRLANEQPFTCDFGGTLRQPCAAPWRLHSRLAAMTARWRSPALLSQTERKSMPILHRSR